MKDLEVVSLALTAEYMVIDSENHLFRQLPGFLSNKIERSVYNRRKRTAKHITNTLKNKRQMSKTIF